ncbi:MAG: thiamine diphosphokinase [Acutalibacteraceae bacterium]
MKSGICFVVGAGENFGLDIKPSDKDLVIAADAGLVYLRAAGISPDIIIGDFDSLSYVPEGPGVIRLNTRKDETDMLSAVQRGIELGYSEFHIYCGTGGRIDHTVANIQLLTYLARRGMTGFLFGKDSVMTVIENGEYKFGGELTGFVSVFSLSDESRGVYLENLKYELENAVITNAFPIGTSNEFIGKPGKIRVENGTALIVLPRNRK